MVNLALITAVIVLLGLIPMMTTKKPFLRVEEPFLDSLDFTNLVRGMSFELIPELRLTLNCLFEEKISLDVR